MNTVSETEFRSPEPTNWNESLIGEVAERIASTLGFVPGSDIKEFVETKLGGEVKVDDWRDPAPTGMIQVRGPGDFTIWLSPYTGPTRDVFTIAHELGHYFLHSKAGQTRIEVKREGTSREEWEANWFAAAFLLPKAAFTSAWQECGGDKDLIAARFRVSDAVVNIRAERLKLKR